MLQRQDIGAADKAVLMALQQFGWKSKICRKPNAVIAAACGLSVKTVSRSVKRLHQLGIINVIKTKSLKVNRILVLRWLDDPEQHPHRLPDRSEYEPEDLGQNDPAPRQNVPQSYSLVTGQETSFSSAPNSDSESSCSQPASDLADSFVERPPIVPLPADEPTSRDVDVSDNHTIPEPASPQPPALTLPAGSTTSRGEPDREWLRTRLETLLAKTTAAQKTQALDELAVAVSIWLRDEHSVAGNRRLIASEIATKGPDRIIDALDKTLAKMDRGRARKPGAVFRGELEYADETDCFEDECEDRGFVVPFRLSKDRL